jgi:ABC-type polar amino acid transport system ATPase subunit
MTDVGETVPSVRMINVSKSFGNALVLDDVDLDVTKGETLVIIGASGSGKTTLLRCLIGLVQIDAGRIEVDGDCVVDRRAKEPPSGAGRGEAIRRRKLGMVFQSYNLFPHRTALENIIEAPVYVRHVPKAKAVERAEALLAQVGLADRRNYYPSQLSGGQQQRVAILRALAMDPEVLLLDEVTSALDPELTDEVLITMSDLAQAGQTMIVVTHEMGFARHVASRVAFMDGGRIVELGSPGDVLIHPKALRTQRFLSKVLHLRD